MTAKLVLRTALGKYDYVAPLRDGRVQSDRVEFDFVDIEPLPKAFRAMLRDGGIDLGEMAVVTHLLGHHHGFGFTGLAVPLWGRLPHENLVCPVQSALNTLKELEGTTVGVRSWAQTSGVWVRGILAHDYGVDIDAIKWLTMEDAHVTTYQDPAICSRNTTGQGLRDLMLAGELSAIMGERVVSPESIRTVIPNAKATAKEWCAKSGFFPINHGLLFDTNLHNAHPWLGAELMRMFTEAREIALRDDGAEAPPVYGLEANRASIQLLLDYSAEQYITPRRYLAEELFLPL